MADYQPYLSAAVAAAREAGERLRAGMRGFRTVHASTAHDVKIEADRACEALIRERLAASAPFPVIGEEEGGDPSLIARNEPYWVIDPLDGTFNYLRDIPTACVSIGLMRGETAVAGVIFDFYRDELFSAVATEPLALNGEPHKPAWAGSIREACLATGFPAKTDFSAEGLTAFVHQAQTFKKVRMIGSAAIAAAWVAAGRFDVYHETGINLWDVGAGIALVQAAGGCVRLTPVDPARPLVYEIWAAGSPALIPG